MKKSTILVLEGIWWKSQKAPLTLPFLNALTGLYPEIEIRHRSIRNLADIEYYVRELRKGSKSMVYIACHGDQQVLCPSDGVEIEADALGDALSKSAYDSISFVHFSCCEMINENNREDFLNSIMDATGADWVSGYSESADWIQSMLLDIAMIAEVFLDFNQAKDKREAPLKRSTDKFFRLYEQLASELGFSAYASVSSGRILFPQLND